jgi:hypothetical protein
MAEDAPKTEKVAKVPTGMVEFTYDKDLGTVEAGEVQLMHKSTADALVAHKIGKITKVVTKITKD